MPDAATKVLGVELVTNAPTFVAEMQAAALSVKELKGELVTAGATMSTALGAATKEIQAFTLASRAAAVTQKEISVASAGMASGLRAGGNELANLTRPLTAFSATGRQGVDVMTRMTSAGSGLMGSLTSAGGAATVAAAGVGVLAAIGVKSFLKMADDARALQVRMGGTAEEASGLAAIMRHFGVDIDAGATSMQRMAVNLGRHTDLLDRWGVATAHTASGNTDMVGTLENVAQRFTQIQDPTERARLGADLFGRQWTTLIPILNQGREGIRALYEDAAKHGELLSQDDIKKAKEFEISMRDLKTHAEAWAASLGRSVVPELEHIVKLVDGIMGAFRGDSGAPGGNKGGVPGMLDWLDQHAHAAGRVVTNALSGNVDPNQTAYGQALSEVKAEDANKRAGDAAKKAAGDHRDNASAMQDEGAAGETDAEKQARLVDVILNGGPAAAKAREELVGLVKGQQEHAKVLDLVRDQADGYAKALKDQKEAQKDAAEAAKVERDEQQRLADLKERAAKVDVDEARRVTEINRQRTKVDEGEAKRLDELQRQSAQNTRDLAKADQEVAKSRGDLATKERELQAIVTTGLAAEEDRLQTNAARATLSHAAAVRTLADDEQKLDDLVSFGLAREHQQNVAALATARRDEAKATQDEADAQRALNDLQSFGLAEQTEQNSIAATRARMTEAQAVRTLADDEAALKRIRDTDIPDQRERVELQAVRTAQDRTRAIRDEASAEKELARVTQTYAEALERADIAAERGQLRSEDAQQRLADLKERLRNLQDPNTSIALSDDQRQKEILQTQRDIRSAQLDVRESAIDASDAEKALAEERQNGLQQRTQDAEDKLAASRQRVVDTTIAARNAQRDLNNETANEVRMLSDAQNKVTADQLAIREAVLATTQAERTQATEAITQAREVQAAKDAITASQERSTAATQAEADANRTLSREYITQAGEMQAAQAAVDGAQLQLHESAVADRTAQSDLTNAWAEGGRLAALLKGGVDGVSGAQDTLSQKIDAVTRLTTTSGQIEEQVQDVKRSASEERNRLQEQEVQVHETAAQEHARITQEIMQVQQTAADQLGTIHDRAEERQRQSMATMEQWLADLQAKGDGVISHFGGTPNGINANGGVGNVPYGPAQPGGANFYNANSANAAEYNAAGPGPSAWGYPSTSSYPRYAGGGNIGPGFKTDGPTAIAGEGNPAHPEWVIATDPKYRPNNVAYWKQAGKDLGMFAGGGSLQDSIDQLPKPMGLAPGDTDYTRQVPAVAEAAAWKSAADAVTTAYNAQQAAASSGGGGSTYNVGAGTGAPSDQVGYAKSWGNQYGLDPVVLLAIAGQETDFGRLGLGREGYWLGYGAYDTGPDRKHPEWLNEGQYHYGAQTLSGWGVHTIADIVSGKAASWATDPGWESGVNRWYGQLKNSGYEHGGMLTVGVMDQGGLLMPGWNLNYNGTGGPEVVNGPHAAASVNVNLNLPAGLVSITGGGPDVQDTVAKVVVPMFQFFAKDLERELRQKTGAMG